MDAGGLARPGRFVAGTTLRASSSLELPASRCWLKQVHGARVVMRSGEFGTCRLRPMPAWRTSPGRSAPYGPPIACRSCYVRPMAAKSRPLTPAGAGLRPACSKIPCARWQPHRDICSPGWVPPSRKPPLKSATRCGKRSWRTMRGRGCFRAECPRPLAGRPVSAGTTAARSVGVQAVFGGGLVHLCRPGAVLFLSAGSRTRPYGELRLQALKYGPCGAISGAVNRIRACG